MAVPPAGMAPAPAAKAGSWTQIASPAPIAVSMMLLLTDGSVLCQASLSNEWWRLSPDRSGRYVGGRWQPCGNSRNAPLYYASAVLADGKVMMAGGEDNWDHTQADDLCAAELFDPHTATWSTLTTTPAGWTKIGDAPCAVLPDGRFLVGSIEGNPCAIYDPHLGSWTDTGKKQNGTCEEETWTLLPDGSVLTVDCEGAPGSERYLGGAWQYEDDTPVALVEAASQEIGPATLLPSGRVFAIGATGNTAIFTPPSGSGRGTWQAGPVFPKDADGRQLGAKDAPACLLPNGRVLCAVGPVNGVDGDYLAPTAFFEFDPTKSGAAALAKLPTQPGNASLGPYAGRLLLLPSGEVMFVNGTADIWFYQPDGAPNPNWVPKVTTVPPALAQGGSYQLEGTQLNGLSQACSYGDDASLATNYPLVRLRSVATGEITFCPTSGHSTMAVATGAKPVTTRFQVPAGLPPGNHRLAVVANALVSEEVAVSIAGVGNQPAAAPAANQAAQVPAANQAARVAAAVRGGAGTTGFGWLAVVLLVGTFAVNILYARTYLVEVWLLSLLAVAASLACIGMAAGRPESTFIDNRNRMSLSKFQVMLWTVAIFSALLGASCFNAGDPVADATKIIGVVVDPKLWALLGISITAAVGAPLALSGKGSRTASGPELADTQRNLKAMTGVPIDHIQNEGHVLVKADQADARWSDLVRGDDVGNGDMIDFSKVQQLYFTLLTLLIFGLSVAKEFTAFANAAAKLAAHLKVKDAAGHPVMQAVIEQLPTTDSGFLGLLAASGAGYLVYKGMSHSKDA